MGRFLRRQRLAGPPGDGVWQVPPRFNFTRDVVEPLAADPLRPALTFVDRDGVIDRRTFAEVATEANRWAALLRARGLAPGDRLLVLVGKTPAWPSVVLGALKAGLVTVPCSELLRAGDLDFRAEHGGARLVVADRDRASELGRMKVPVEAVIVEDAADELRAHSAVQPTEDTASADIAFILYTSGTTKHPKGATHTHAYTWAKRLQAEHWLDARPSDLVWCTAGTGWAKSIWNVLLGPWSRGAEIVLHDGGFDAEQRFELIQQLGVTVLCQAPTEYRLMAKLPALRRFDLGRLRHAVSAGEPLNPEVISAFQTAYGLTVYDGYGQTENTLLVANVRGTSVRPGSMGLPTPGHDVAVIDEDGREAPVDVEGDIALRGRPPSLFLGYWNAPEETRAMFRGDWYLTGDRAARDADGYFWFTGRSDDVILSAAYRIGPFEVESALLEHPAVAESAVVGKPDADRGELVKAFVVLRQGVEPTEELVAELQNHVKTVTAPYKYPREIEFVATLPKTASGKIRRVELRERERAAARDMPLLRFPAESMELPPPAEPTPEADTGRLEEEALARAEDELRASQAAAREAAGEAERGAREAAAQEAAERAAADAEQRRIAVEATERERIAALTKAQARAAERERQERQQADEKLRREEEKIAAEQERRDAEERRRAAKAKARDDERKRKDDDRQRKEAEKRRREEAEAQKKQAERLRKEDESRARRGRKATIATVSKEGEDDEVGVDDGRPNSTLIARLRAYGRREDTADPVDDPDPVVDPDRPAE